MMLHRHALPALALVLLLPGCTEETIEPLDLNGPPSAVAGAGGDDQSATVGTALPLPLSVQITDEDGEPVPAVGVAWTVSGGTLSAPSDTTDENGASSVIWTMPPTPGDYTATATVPGLGQVSFDAEALPLLGDLVFRFVDAGGFHACGLTITDQRVCWGYNADGQLGGEAGPPELYPTVIPGENRFRIISNGWYHGCGIDFALEVFCWGEDRDLRATTNLVPSYQDIDAGLTHTCAVSIARDIWCWGYNYEGQLGPGFTSEPLPPIQIASDFRSVSTGGIHSCGIEADGDAVCWGFNADGQLGLDIVGPPVPTPTAVVTAVNFQTEPVTTPPSPDPDQPLPLGPYISAGYAHTCGIATSGAAYCWGLNEDGQVGDGTNARRDAPTGVTMPAGVQFGRIGAGLSHTCALTVETVSAPAGDIYCWGDNTWGQLGDGGISNQAAPVPIVAPTGAIFAWISAGENHTCAVTTLGVAYCWGDNHYGQLGDGTTNSSSVPVKVALQP